MVKVTTIRRWRITPRKWRPTPSTRCTRQASKSRDPKAIADLGEALEKINPKSQYMWLVSPRYLASLSGKGCAEAAKLAGGRLKNAEAMIFAADCSWRGNNAAAVISNANRALEALNSRPKTEGGNEGSKVATANFFVGAGNAMQQRWGPANKALRAALPSLKGDPTYEANALFNLRHGELFSLVTPSATKARSAKP